MKSTLGLVFSYKDEEGLNQLTHARSLASIPYGGRYRVIDFQLSALVNSGVTKVGLITQNNYSSLMDHVGSGKEWDLARKRDGLFFLPPYFIGERVRTSNYHGRVEALANILKFVQDSNEEYVLLCDADSIFSGTYDEMMDFHLEKGADMTVLYKPGHFDGESFDQFCFLKLDEDDRVSEVTIDPITDRTKLCVGTILMKKTLLETLIRDCQSHNRFSFRQDIMQAHLKDLKIYGYKYTGYYKALTTVDSYFDANMDLLDPAIRAELLNTNSIHTKIRDEVPSVYRGCPSVTNSLVADGCVIEGTVENSIIFRGVHIRKGALVVNSIIMQDCDIQSGARLNYVIADKDVIIRENRTLYGYSHFPTVLSKGSVV